MDARLPAPFVPAAGGFLCLMLGAGCASPRDDVHLAPLYSHLSTAGGEDEHEALGGVLRTRRERPDGKLREWELHPLVCRDEFDTQDGHDDAGRMEESSYTRFLVPLGTHREWPDRSQTQLLPLVRVDREPDANGQPGWRLTAWPLTLWGEDSTGRTLQGVFPFGGVWDNFATYDRISFFMFPVYMRTERDGGVYHHLLWPLFSWGRNKRGELDAHVWPLAGVSRPGHSEGGFLAWPLVTWSREGLERPESQQATTWMFWPFYGERRQQTYSAWNALWPFFGYAEDERSGYWSWAGPWPFVKVQRPGTSGEARISRAWPFYSHVESDGLDSRWFLWPIFNQRHETYATGERHGEVVFPFWDHFVEDDREGRRVASWSKLWPLYQYREQEGRSRFAFPTLLPLLHMPDIDEHYGWLWELYRRESGTGRTQERAWLGLWRRERDEAEVREYASGLWSRRKYRREGDMVRETSFLFGLLRWRESRASGLEFLRPAFPGPGWPARESGGR
jgi:hypothetical protein